MTFNEAAAILNTPSNPNTQLDNAIYVYRNLGTLADQIILGNKFQDYFNKHQHTVYGAPTSPPTVPSTPDHLSKVVKTQ